MRLPPRNLALFEVVINAIRKAAPGAAIAFNTRPDDSADAAARGLALQAAQHPASNKTKSRPQLWTKRAGRQLRSGQGGLS